MSLLRLEKIEAAYGKKEVLRGVSLTVEKEEIVAFIGPNGAGKSTLLKVISGFLKPLKGRIWIDGRDITDLVPYERMSLGLAYFMQGGKVFPNLTVEENLEIGAIALSPQEKKKRISSVFEIFFNLNDFQRRRAGLLSGGERQALALSMVLLNRPQILLLDEPSSGLSPIYGKKIISIIQDINVRWGTTILLVEQNVHFALQIARRIIGLVNGELILETRDINGFISNRTLERIFFEKRYHVSL